jgi:hypothetical protein
MERYEKALIRNLNELGQAWLERMAITALEAAGEWHGWDFFRITYQALFNDMVSHMIKVLDLHRDSASFWYIYNCKRKEIDAMFSPTTMGINHIELLADKLKHIRDKTHFHIDKDALFDPKKVWKDADISTAELKMVMQHLLDVLYRLHFDHFGNEFPMPEYTGDDAYNLVKLAVEKDLI